MITGLHSKIGLCDEENSANCNTGSDSQGSSRSQDIYSDKGDENYQCQEEEISIFNKSLLLLGESPLDKHKLQTLKSYSLGKKKKLKKLVKRKLDLVSPNSDAIAIDTSEDNEYKATKKKLLTQSKSEKIMILTIFVAQWSNRKVRREFNCSHQLVSQAKEVLIAKGVLSTPNSKKGKSLPVHVKDMVKEFYYSDIVSHAMPGKKDFLSVMENEERKHIQKWLVLSKVQISESGFRCLQSYVQKNVSLQEQVLLTVCVYVPCIKMLSL